MAGIGNKISENMQLQEFVEKVLAHAFNEYILDDLGVAEEICDEMGITEEEMYWMFEQLGYTREDQ